jgi:hypothetical protein
MLQNDALVLKAQSVEADRNVLKRERDALNLETKKSPSPG